MSIMKTDDDEERDCFRWRSRRAQREERGILQVKDCQGRRGRQGNEKAKYIIRVSLEKRKEGEGEREASTYSHSGQSEGGGGKDEEE